MGIGEKADLAGENTQKCTTEAGGAAVDIHPAIWRNRLQKGQGLAQGQVVIKWQSEGSNPNFLPPTVHFYHKNQMRGYTSIAHNILQALWRFTKFNYLILLIIL